MTRAKKIDSGCLICPYCNNEVTTEKKGNEISSVDNIVETVEHNSVVNPDNGKPFILIIGTLWYYKYQFYLNFLS